MKMNNLTVKLAALLVLRCITVEAGTVVNLNDSGPGSLRQVIQDAGVGETITFSQGLSGTIVLTSGQLPINQNLTIQGPGAKSLTIAADSTRIFSIESPVNVSISGLTLTGHASIPAGTGGGIYNGGNLSLVQCHITGCTATGSAGNPGEGGGIASVGNLAMTACAVSYCRAAGGDAPSGSAGPGLGGGLYVLGSMALTN